MVVFFRDALGDSISSATLVGGLLSPRACFTGKKHLNLDNFGKGPRSKQFIVYKHCLCYRNNEKFFRSLD